jgi:hypothetical protein
VDRICRRLSRPCRNTGAESPVAGPRVDYPPYRLLAEVHMARGRFDLALGQTELALEINPSDGDTF